jgi:MSHA pilin protein MshC
MRRPDRNRRAPASSTGFTLIELVVVMTIAAILAVVAAPKFFDQNVFTQRGYADELAAALRYAQKAAVNTGCPARINLTATAYTGQQQAASGNTCNTLSVAWTTPILRPDGSALAGTAPSNTTPSAGSVGNYTFDGTGKPTTVPSASIVVSNTQTAVTRTISVDALTGYIQVQ